MTPGEETAKQGSLSLKEMEDNIARLPSVYNSLPWNAFCFLQVETFFFRGRETSAIRWLVQKKKKIRWLRAGNCIVPKKKDYFSYILKKKILLPERGGSAQERFFFRGAAALASEEEHMEFVPCGLCAGPFVFCFRTVGQRGVQTPDNGYEFFSFSSATRESRGVRGVRLVRFSTGHGQYRTCTVVRVRGPS